MSHNLEFIKKIRNEFHLKFKEKHSIKDIKKWYSNIVKNSKTSVKKISLSECKNWSIINGEIRHNSKKFFKIEALRTNSSYKREIKNGWDQPIITEPGYKGGILGLLRKEIDGNPYYLINAKFEPGNYRKIQLSPTLQATFSNIAKAHGGKEPRYLKYFQNPKKNNCEIIFKQWFSEEGGRLRNKRNLGILINLDPNKKIVLDEDFKWISMKQIKFLILENAMINPHLRGLVSFI